MEKLGVDVDQVVSYFAWADDYGPDGQVRRTFSDMFFAEVRPFEEIFRADQSGAAESGRKSAPAAGPAGRRKPKHAAGGIAEADRHRHLETSTRQTSVRQRNEAIMNNSCEFNCVRRDVVARR